MTNEIAIHRLLLVRHRKDCTELLAEALDMAIKALEKQDDEPVGCYGCVHERHGNQVCDACARSCLDRYVGGEVG